MFRVKAKYYISGLGYGFVPDMSEDITIIRNSTKFQNQRTRDIFTVGYVEVIGYDIERGPLFKVGEPDLIIIKSLNGDYTKSKEIFENTNINDTYCLTAD